MTRRLISAAIDRTIKGESAVNYMIEVELVGGKGFLMLMETLTRICIPSAIGGACHQVAHVLRHGGKYYIAHYKQLRAMNGEIVAASRSELARTSRIAKMLSKWGMIRIIYPLQCDIEKGGMIIIPFKDVDKYKLVSHYKFEKSE